MASLLNEGGYDYEFVPQLAEDFICPICHLAMRDPVQTTICGHLFCRDCLTKFHEGYVIYSVRPPFVIRIDQQD